ncbi:ferritin-like domain-containing protein [Arthrobacter sp. R1-13]
MSTSPTDNARRDRFLADLLGVMAYGELSAFERYSADARYSPTLHDRAVMGRIAVLEFQHYELVSARLAGLGVDAEEAMLPFQPAIDHFHDRTRPADWYESLMKAYVIDTVSADFYRAVSEYVEPESRQLIRQVQSAEDVTEILRVRLKKALSDDPRLASRLALWGRRLLGEALTQAQRVGFERAFLSGLIASQGNDPPGSDSGVGIVRDDAEAKLMVADLMKELAGNHSRRMTQLGLTG